MAVTDYIQTTESLLDFVATCLKGYTGWNVVKYPGSGTKDVFKMIPSVGLPAAIIVYSSSSYGNRPRRNASFSVIVASEFSQEDDRKNARTLMDKAIALLDNQISSMALFRVTSDRALELGANIAAYEVQFKIEDH